MRRGMLPAVLLAVASSARGGWALGGEEHESVSVSPKSRFSVTAGVGAPLGPAAGAELLVGLGADVQDDSEHVKGLLGVLAQVQAGRGGGKLSLGVGAHANVRTEDFNGPVALGLKASLVRTSRYRERHRTYLGPELDVSVLRLQATLGLLARVHGPGPAVLFDWALGVRF